MQDLSFLKYFLGIEVAHNLSRLYLTQPKYILDIISKTGLSGFKPAPTPIEQNHQLTTNKSVFLLAPDQYRDLLDF